ncbi:DUF1076 domain-containing protein [Escherichia coli]|uniref:DUF1076 domain-containing protein n=1 Tax=Escherichia sp. MOD1-EC7003 TaxID=2093900 RepID=UPI000CF759C8|nr:DUF1076 domain-containing protein [Escherichia sp. MOD1-EC7003]EGO8361697.1 DUF1076 domain-containing protein [Escherichia coli]EGO8379242.1 DUF1076 domain-containing protein [Escherichia coli]EHR8838382.1 DUF1076 domain-containing protein [Escherichia coli]
MPLTTDIMSHSFSLGMQALRAQVADSGRGEITVGNQTVSIVYDQENDRYLAGDDNGGLLSGLLLLGFNNGPEALAERMLSMLSGSGEVQAQQNIQEKIEENKFSVNPEHFQCSPESVICPITLEKPEEGVFIKNSADSVVCCLFNADAFSRLVSENLPHPLTREPITVSMIVKPEECIYDHTRGNFIVK